VWHFSWSSRHERRQSSQLSRHRCRTSSTSGTSELAQERGEQRFPLPSRHRSKESTGPRREKVAQTACIATTRRKGARQRGALLLGAAGSSQSAGRRLLGTSQSKVSSLTPSTKVVGA